MSRRKKWGTKWTCHIFPFGFVLLVTLSSAARLRAGRGLRPCRDKFWWWCCFRGAADPVSASCPLFTPVCSVLLSTVKWSITITRSTSVRAVYLWRGFGGVVLAALGRILQLLDPTRTLWLTGRACWYVHATATLWETGTNSLGWVWYMNTLELEERKRKGMCPVVLNDASK